MTQDSGVSVPAPPPNPQIAPSMTNGPKQPSRAGWFLLGAIFGLIAGILMAAVVGRASSLEKVPMTVSFRGAILDRSFVGVFSNQGGKLLRNVAITCENEALKERKVYKYSEWSPGVTIEIGWQEGWKWQARELVTIEADGYAPVSLQFKGD